MRHLTLVTLNQLPIGVSGCLNVSEVRCTLGLDISGSITCETVFWLVSIVGNALASVRDSDIWLGYVGDVVFCLRVHGFVFIEHAAVHGANVAGFLVKLMVSRCRLKYTRLSCWVNRVAVFNAASDILSGGYGFNTVALVFLHLLFDAGGVHTFGGIDAD